MTTQTTAAGRYLERRFRLAERGTSVRIEVTGGVTTFLTMAYILLVSPQLVKRRAASCSSDARS